jgi:hypothetical protein
VQWQVNAQVRRRFVRLRILLIEAAGLSDDDDLASIQNGIEP